MCDQNSLLLQYSMAPRSTAAWLLPLGSPSKDGPLQTQGHFPLLFHRGPAFLGFFFYLSGHFLSLLPSILYLTSHSPSAVRILQVCILSPSLHTRSHVRRKLCCGFCARLSGHITMEMGSAPSSSLVGGREARETMRK